MFTMNLPASICLKSEHVYNLVMLADFLENVITDKQFNILHYRAENADKSCAFKDKNNCGTIGCALGWAPFIINLTEADFNHPIYDSSFKTLDFRNYSARIFGCTDSSYEYGEYVFSSKWGDNPKQKTRLATVKRIREIVKIAEIVD